MELLVDMTSSLSLITSSLCVQLTRGLHFLWCHTGAEPHPLHYNGHLQRSYTTYCTCDSLEYTSDIIRESNPPKMIGYIFLRVAWHTLASRNCSCCHSDTKRWHATDDNSMFCHLHQYHHVTIATDPHYFYTYLWFLLYTFSMCEAIQYHRVTQWTV